MYLDTKYLLSKYIIKNIKIIKDKKDKRLNSK